MSLYHPPCMVPKKVGRFLVGNIAYKVERIAIIETSRKWLSVIVDSFLAQNKFSF